MMTTFFHELGHAAAFWFYGIVAVPSFDVTYGGGMTYAVTGQMWPLNLAVYGVLIYLFQKSRGHTGWQIVFAGLGLFHVATAYNNFHDAVCVFAGPLAETILAGFFMTRAWLNLAPRGVTERFLNGAFGCGMALHAGLQAWALIHDSFVRDTFFTCKGGEGLGDFDRIADLMNVNFSTVVWVWMTCCVMACVVPLCVYVIHRRQEIRCE